MAQKGFDVAIVDVKLPDVSGVDLIQPLRAASPFSEVLLLTGFASVDAAIGALRSGAFAFVLKSFRPEELISTVEQALDEGAAQARARGARAPLPRSRRGHRRARRRARRRRRGRAHEPQGREPGRHDAASRRSAGRSSSRGSPRRIARAMRAALAEHARASSQRAHEVETGFVDQSVAVDARARRDSLAPLALARCRGDLVYGIGIDVTERRALEKRAADAEALSAMGELAMNLAHEIRNPLNAAVLQLHLLNRNLDRLEADEPTRAALQGPRAHRRRRDRAPEPPAHRVPRARAPARDRARAGPPSAPRRRGARSRSGEREGRGIDDRARPPGGRLRRDRRPREAEAGHDQPRRQRARGDEAGRRRSRRACGPRASASS